jgi:condensin complex subunit 2
MIAEHSDEIDENFWAKAAADAALPAEDGVNQDAEGMPFATQFFNDEDDYGGGGFDDDGGGEGLPPGLDEDAELLAATQGQVRRARPEFVKYAKKVKRVDVRKLKENIWKGLDIVLPKTEEEVFADSIDRWSLTHSAGR